MKVDIFNSNCSHLSKNDCLSLTADEFSNVKLVTLSENEYLVTLRGITF